MTDISPPGWTIESIRPSISPSPEQKLSEEYPELPVVSFHQLLTWDRCRFLWKMKYVDKWEKTRKGYAMELGTMGHAMLFDYYKTGQDHSEDFANKWLADWEHLDAEQMQNVGVAVSQFKLYRELFAPQEDKGLITEFLEHHFEVIITTPGGRRFILQGYIDRGSRDKNGNLWLEDYKWTGRFWSPLQLLMDAQLTYYAGAMLMLGYPVYGLMITQVNTYPYKNRDKKKIDELFKRERFAKTHLEIRNVMHEVGCMMDEMLEAKEREDFRRSLTRECGKCDFQEPCHSGLTGMDPLIHLSFSPVFHRKEKGRSSSEGGIPELQPPRLRITDDYIVEDQSIIIE